MANFRGQSTKGVDLGVALYDKSVAHDKESGELKAAFPTTYVHPDSELAAGQTQLALNSRRDDKAPSGYNNSAAYSAKQFDAIKEAAGDNTAPLTDREGNEVGTIYGVKADVMPASDKSGMVINTKSVEPSELAVQPGENDKSFQDKVVETHKESAAAKKEQKQAPEAQNEAQAEAPQAESQEPELG